MCDDICIKWKESDRESARNKKIKKSTISKFSVPTGKKTKGTLSILVARSEKQYVPLSFSSKISKKQLRVPESEITTTAMTSILDRLNSEDETGRIEQLETELESVRNAFEEYVSTTEGLEVEVKKELHEMRK